MVDESLGLMLKDYFHAIYSAGSISESNLSGWMVSARMRLVMYVLLVTCKSGD